MFVDSLVDSVITVVSNRNVTMDPMTQHNLPVAWRFVGSMHLIKRFGEFVEYSLSEGLRIFNCQS